MNMHYMMLHTGAFCLYLFFSLFYYVSLGFYLFNPGSQDALKAYTITSIVYTVGSFISQLLLCQIFYDLSERHKELPPPSRAVKPPLAKIVKKGSKTIKEISEEDNKMNESYQMTIATTEDAHLQSRIWNRFIKNRPLTSEERDEVTISAEYLTTSLRMTTKVMHDPSQLG